jgi:hypothetical protein
MKVPWKIVGLAGVAGVTAATGVVVARKRRDHTDYDPDVLRDKLHSRVADATEDDADAAAAEAPTVVGEPAPSPAPVDEPAPWQQAPVEGHTGPEAPADEPAA